MLNTKLATILSIAADERVSLNEEKDFASILENISEVKQGISDIEVWVYNNQDLLTKKEIASAVTLTNKKNLNWIISQHINLIKCKGVQLWTDLLTGY